MLIRSALVAATAAALTVVPVTAATAQTYRHTDTTQDLQSVDLSSSSDFTFAPAPDATEPDVKSIQITHGARRVNVAMRFVDLTKAATAAVYEAEVRTNERLLRVVDVEAGPGEWRGRQSFSGPLATPRCKGLSHSIDYDKNVVAFSIPRSCLSKPRWVKVAAMAGDEVVATTTPADGSAPTSTDTGYFDDAQNSKFGFNETWSPRIHKG